MSASDHLSPRLFHSTNADLAPGDLIHPGHDPEGTKSSASYDYESVGHPDFAWASKHMPKAYFGNKHYEVEPTGLTHDYTPHETPGGVMTRMDSPNAKKRMIHSNYLHAHNVVSLAPLRVKGRVDRYGKPLK